MPKFPLVIMAMSLVFWSKACSNFARSEAWSASAFSVTLAAYSFASTSESSRLSLYSTHCSGASFVDHPLPREDPVVVVVAPPRLEPLLLRLLSAKLLALSNPAPLAFMPVS